MLGDRQAHAAGADDANFFLIRHAASQCCCACMLRARAAKARLAWARSRLQTCAQTGGRDMHRHHRPAALALAAAFALAMPATAPAQTLPNKPIKIVVGFSA